MSHLLQLNDVSVIFEGKTDGVKHTIPAMVDVNLSFDSGEIVALVGESGCGKTTLGKVLTGLQKPTKGELFYKGKNVWSMNKAEFAEYRSSVQLVQQDSYAALNPAKTIFQSLSAPILQNKIVKGKKAAHEKVCELLRTVELTPPEQFLEKYPHQLSGGQRQRVLMARAISLNPKLIVADEPVSMVDVSLRLSILNLMAKLNKEMGIAFVYITHDLATARYIAKNGRLAVMYLGKIVELGSVRNVLAAPRHPYLQALLTAVPVPDPKVAKGKRELPLKSLEMPSISNPPSGCAFNPRCPYADETCVLVQPKLDFHGDDLVACHHAERIPEWKLVTLAK
ncbi:ABC transporter ATP-binding protein [Lederbergia wuyishanensis]|uniref:Peptide/nickel transport system ATP-binding protein n=1 Tax=Lederbergia wuyishanensis TaxID=1347903 RepID=A0ABU0D9E1_9BACI|nr:ABC transporter ATP-binding protein [Lederbergia wuyishanensis]MCJ8007521.1 ABC transporter ATP-binding protein [Lederbergia wuyishanensis]MDQ0345039.1 peptide/nickel transport system ATP-binding protein [Lederbergia wuyishanensis]